MSVDWCHHNLVWVALVKDAKEMAKAGVQTAQEHQAYIKLTAEKVRTSTHLMIKKTGCFGQSSEIS